MDYPCGKFGDCSFSHFGLSCGQTDTQTDTDERIIPTTLVGVSNYIASTKPKLTFVALHKNNFHDLLHIFARPLQHLTQTYTHTILLPLKQNAHVKAL